MLDTMKISPHRRFYKEKEFDPALEENWCEVLLTPENIMTTKKPLSPPKRREETYTSLQEFLLGTPCTPVYPIISPSKSPTSVNSTSPEKTRWAGPAFCNSPSPTSLPLPSFEKLHSSPLLPTNPEQENTKINQEVSKHRPIESNALSSNDSYRRKITKKEKLVKTRENPPNKKKTTYVPKQKTMTSEQNSAFPSQSLVSENLQLEHLSNQLRVMLNLKTN